MSHHFQSFAIILQVFDPSFNVSLHYSPLHTITQGEWMEVLGCGVIHKEVLTNANMGHKHGWAFGLGTLLCFIFV